MYGCRGVVEQSDDVGRLDDLAGVHHGDTSATLGDDAEVVGDEHDRRAAIAR